MVLGTNKHLVNQTFAVSCWQRTSLPAKIAVNADSCSAFNVNSLTLTRFKSLKAIATKSSSAAIVVVLKVVWPCN